MSSTPSSSGKTTTKKSSDAHTKAVLDEQSLVLSGVNCTFLPTKQMQLQNSELQLCAYVFNSDQDASEVILQIGSVSMSRMQLQCLCPGKTVHDEADVNQGQNIEVIAENYSSDWMMPFSTLKYIYVPIKDEREHWFLMVISIKDQIVYQLDPCLQSENIIQKREMISKMCKVIAEIMSTDNYPTNFLSGSNDFTTWKIKEAMGMPNNVKSETSVVWVLDWLEMEHGFHTNLCEKLDEDVVRMWTAITLLRGPHNELRHYLELELKTEAYWSTIQPI